MSFFVATQIKLSFDLTKVSPRFNHHTEININRDMVELSEIVLFSTHEEYHMVMLSEILYLKSAGNYSTIYLRNGEQILISKQLKEMEKKLPANFFIRIHHKYLVNKIYVSKYHKQESVIYMLNNESLPVAVRRRNDLFLCYTKI